MTAAPLVELPLDDELLKVLSSDTRRDILRLLAERRMTGTEIAQRLGLGKPAVSEHLKKLHETDLVTRHDDPERRWVYFQLSPRGRTILEPQRVRFFLVLSVAVVAVLVGVALALAATSMWGTIGNNANVPQAAGADNAGLDETSGLGNNVVPVVPSVPSQGSPGGLVENPAVAKAPLVTSQAALAPSNHSFQLLVPDGASIPTAPDPSREVYLFTAYDIDQASGTVSVQSFEVTPRVLASPVTQGPPAPILAPDSSPQASPSASAGTELPQPCTVTSPAEDVGAIAAPMEQTNVSLPAEDLLNDTLALVDDVVNGTTAVDATGDAGTALVDTVSDCLPADGLGDFVNHLPPGAAQAIRNGHGSTSSTQPTYEEPAPYDPAAVPVIDESHDDSYVPPTPSKAATIAAPAAPSSTQDGALDAASQPDVADPQAVEAPAAAPASSVSPLLFALAGVAGLAGLVVLVRRASR